MLFQVFLLIIYADQFLLVVIYILYD